MRVHFTKMQGCGNDYIYFDCFTKQLSEPEKLAARLSDRHFGIGGDGIVLILPPEQPENTARMRMFNADGSEGKMCGNASRCIGKYLFDRGYTDDNRVRLETLSGVKSITLNIENGRAVSARVDMGRAEFAPDKLPARFTCDSVIGRDAVPRAERQKTLYRSAIRTAS